MNNKVFSLLLALPLCLSSLSYAQSHPPVVVYDDALAAGWTDWSWSVDKDLSFTKAPHGGSSAIAVTAKPWGCFALHSDGISTAGLSKLSFWVNGGETGGQQLNVILNGEAGMKTPAKLPVLAKGWNHIELPLSSLGVAPNASLSLIWIQNLSPNPAPTFYLDDISVL